MQLLCLIIVVVMFFMVLVALGAVCCCNCCCHCCDVFGECRGVFIDDVVRIAMIVVDGVVVFCRCCPFDMRGDVLFDHQSCCGNR